MVGGLQVKLRQILWKCSWQPRVPAWEKEFCKVIGSLDWETFLHMKKFIHLYNNVLEWDDSAGEKAFHDAKKRFWAKKQGLPCDDASLPDPDLYIDDINWSSEIDPEILLELECKPEVPKAGEGHETVVIFGDSFLANQAFLSTGWGDNEENFKIPKTNESPAKYGNLGEHYWDGTANGCADYRKNTWHVNDGSGAIRHMASEDGWNHFNGCGYKNLEDKKADNVQRSWDVNNLGRVSDAGQYFPRYRTSRFQGIRAP
ncbi:uncharacterized protein LOC111365968 isoform X2 [Olea europaea var. sylvestris]|uniref:uncharacterized protein LOC111365968 isoform X2 n=1 Tax=Olea europaea var. sylvestris TaxID=158386 RepID=UPI000C1D11A6|nr:uncharacterized protein LOC111365968 isoform X2 [Olea europaea var. sylvestris]